MILPAQAGKKIKKNAFVVLPQRTSPGENN
jgi:hypothetical protein